MAAAQRSRARSVYAQTVSNLCTQTETKPDIQSSGCEILTLKQITPHELSGHDCHGKPQEIQGEAFFEQLRWTDASCVQVTKTRNPILSLKDKLGFALLTKPGREHLRGNTVVSHPYKDHGL